MPPGELLDTDELAVLLREFNADGTPNRAPTYWRRFRGEGPPAIRIGGKRGRLLWRREAIESWLASRTEP